MKKMSALLFCLLAVVLLLVANNSIKVSAHPNSQASEELFFPLLVSGDAVDGAGNEVVSNPTSQPTSEPTSEPTITPTITPTSEPIITPTPVPTSVPTSVQINGPIDGPRVLDISGANVETLTVDNGFGVCHQYGATHQFYQFLAQNAVIAVYFPYGDTSFKPTISVNLFAEGETDDWIEWWIENQYSDAIFSEAPDPIYVETLDEGEYTLTEVNYVERVTGPYGQEYADYSVAYSVADLNIPDQFELVGFDQEALVHIPTKNCFVAQAEPRERTLDISSEETTEFTVDRYFSPCLYGPTQQFFNFGSENAVLRVRFGTEDLNFEPEISIKIFSPEVTAEQIGWWINNQHSDGIFADAPVPIYTRDLDSTEYSIIDSEFIDNAAGPAGDRYDNYRVQYSITDIVEDGRFRLIGFDAETVVHIRTQACGTAEPVPNKRALDVSSDETTEFNFDDSIPPLFLHGWTQQFFNFGSENAVLSVLFSTSDLEFKPLISVDLFAPDATPQEIQAWIDRNFTDVAESTIEPIYTRTLEPSEYSIVSSEFIDSEVGELLSDGCQDEYDNYRVEYSIADITDDDLFELSSFSREVVVHIMTTSC